MEFDFIEIDEEKIKKIKCDALKDILSNKLFSSFIETNKITKEQIYEHVDAFKKVEKSRTVCSKCPGLASCSIKGYTYDLVLKDGELSAPLCQCKRLIEVNKIKSRFVTFEGDKANFDTSLGELQNAQTKSILVSLIKNFNKGDIKNGVYMFGTDLDYSKIMQVYARTIAANTNRLISYINAVNYLPYLSYLKSMVSKSDHYEEEMNDLKTIQVLFIDHLGEEVEGNFINSEILLEIVKTRTENKLPTYFVSKYNPKELIDVYKFTKKGFENISELRKLIDANCDIVTKK